MRGSNKSTCNSHDYLFIMEISVRSKCIPIPKSLKPFPSNYMVMSRLDRSMQVMLGHHLTVDTNAICCSQREIIISSRARRLNLRCIVRYSFALGYIVGRSANIYISTRFSTMFAIKITTNIYATFTRNIQ